MSEQLPDNVLYEMERKNIAARDWISRNDLDRLSPVSQSAIVNAGVKIKDDPQPNNPKALTRAQFNSYSEAEQGRLRQAGYFVTD